MLSAASLNLGQSQNVVFIKEWVKIYDKDIKTIYNNTNTNNEIIIIIIIIILSI